MSSPFENPKEVNPFETIPTPAIEVVVVEKVIRIKSKRNRWLEVPGACCLSYFCGPCYMFANLCCMICKQLYKGIVKTTADVFPRINVYLLLIMLTVS